MGTVRVGLDMPGTVAAAERLWYDTSRWATFVDGFARLVEVDGEWPHQGSRVVWESTPQGRGRVTETVVSYQPGEGQRVSVQDPSLTGTQSVVFEAFEDGVGVALELEYELEVGGALRPLLDPLFIRRQLRAALRRTLERFESELESDLSPSR